MKVELIYMDARCHRDYVQMESRKLTTKHSAVCFLPFFQSAYLQLWSSRCWIEIVNCWIQITWSQAMGSRYFLIFITLYACYSLEKNGIEFQLII
jgi:hypothetical protein